MSGDQYFDALNRHLIDEETEYVLANASLTWRSADARIEVQGWVRNLGDKGISVQDHRQSGGVRRYNHVLPRPPTHLRRNASVLP